MPTRFIDAVEEFCDSIQNTSIFSAAEFKAWLRLCEELENVRPLTEERPPNEDGQDR